MCPRVVALGHHFQIAERQYDQSLEEPKFYVRKASYKGQSIPIREGTFFLFHFLTPFFLTPSIEGYNSERIEFRLQA